MILNEFRYYSDNKQRDDNNGENELHIDAQPIRKFKSLALVCLGAEFVPAKAALMTSKDDEYQRAERKQNVTYYKVLKVEHVSTVTERLEARKHVESEHTGDRKREYCHGIDSASLSSAYTKEIAVAGDYVLKYGKHR